MSKTHTPDCKLMINSPYTTTISTNELMRDAVTVAVDDVNYLRATAIDV